jgi:hypothetical protein
MKSKYVNLLTILVLLITTFQGLVPAMPLGNPATVTLISSIAMFLVSALTAWKQYFSTEISNASLKPTIIIAIIATLGGLNELFQVIPMSNVTGQWVRFGITFLAAFVNLASKLLYPTTETNSKV